MAACLVSAPERIILHEEDMGAAGVAGPVRGGLRSAGTALAVPCPPRHQPVDVWSSRLVRLRHPLSRPLPLPVDLLRFGDLPDFLRLRPSRAAHAVLLLQPPTAARGSSVDHRDR